MARVETGTRQGHAHKYTDIASKKAGAPRTTFSEGHDHKIIRDDGGRAIRLERAGEPPHTHPLK